MNSQSLLNEGHRDSWPAKSVSPHYARLLCGQSQCNRRFGESHGSSRFHCGVGRTRFDRLPNIWKRRDIMVSRRDETPLAPPCVLCKFKLDGAVGGAPGCGVHVRDYRFVFAVSIHSTDSTPGSRLSSVTNGRGSCAGCIRTAYVS